MKIAIITTAHPTYTKGLASFVYEKCRRMKQQEGEFFKVDCFMIRNDVSPFMRFVYRIKNYPCIKWDSHPHECEVQGVKYYCLWIVHTLWDNLVGIRIRKEQLAKRYLKRYGELLKNYDVVCTHTLPAHCLGWYLSKKFDVPYIATWHGSDIHSNPYKSDLMMNWTQMVMKEAAMNFFVSKALQLASNELAACENKDVLYTGAAEHFYKYEAKRRADVRNKMNPKGRLIVGFVGNLIPIKNVMTLPGILKIVSAALGKDNVELWVIGDGIEESRLKDSLTISGVNFIFWGKRQSCEMTDFYNCLDVLIMPSINEGFPLAVIEARSCGASIVGSAVGGIPEAIGLDKNVFPLDDRFEIKVANRIVEILQSKEEPSPLEKEFSWDYAIKKEINKCRELEKIHG